MWHIHMSIAGSYCFFKITVLNNISETSIMRFAGCFKIADVIEPTTGLQNRKNQKILNVFGNKYKSKVPGRRRRHSAISKNGLGFPLLARLYLEDCVIKTFSCFDTKKII